MTKCNRSFTSFAFLATLIVSLLPFNSFAQTPQTGDTIQDDVLQEREIYGLEGDWLYVEDVTEGRPKEKQQPPMSMKFSFRLEKDAMILVRGQGKQRREERISLDGKSTEVVDNNKITRSTGVWDGDTLTYTTEILKENDNSRIVILRKEFRRSPDGLLVRVVVGSPAQMDGIALYQHPKDVALPSTTNAKIADVAWLADSWMGEKGKASVEERWGPPLGGAMFGVSRTVANHSMKAFEFLRIVERDDSLVYVAQPGGGAATEFWLTELGETRAVFDNPRHDFPQRIVYELSDDGTLTASIGFLNGGRPQKFVFRRENN